MSSKSNCTSPGKLTLPWPNANTLRHLRSADSLKYCVYYGKDRTRYLRQLENYQLVITTYSVVRLDWKTQLAEPDGALTLHTIQWRRVVLDEGVYDDDTGRLTLIW